MKIEFIEKSYVLHIEQNIMEPMDYYYQYNESKQIAIDAIRNKLHVVLLGGDATGKTHLTNELEQDGYLNRNMYVRLYEGESYCDYNPNLQRFWIEAHGNINHCLKLIKNESFVVINMSKFKYPGVEDNMRTKNL
jgi:hypothetical protein